MYASINICILKSKYNTIYQLLLELTNMFYNRIFIDLTSHSRHFFLRGDLVPIDLVPLSNFFL